MEVHSPLQRGLESQSRVSKETSHWSFVIHCPTGLSITHVLSKKKYVRQHILPRPCTTNQANNKYKYRDSSNKQYNAPDSRTNIDKEPHDKQEKERNLRSHFGKVVLLRLAVIKHEFLDNNSLRFLLHVQWLFPSFGWHKAMCYTIAAFQ